MCIDYGNLSKASLKADFPLRQVDVLVDNMAGHALLSFICTVV